MLLNSSGPGLTPQDLGEVQTSQNELGPIQVGEIEPAQIEVSYLRENSFRQVVHYPDASYIKVHFSRFDLLPGDTVTVSSPDGSQHISYPGSGYTFGEESGFWPLSIMGDTAIIELHSGGASEEEIDNHAAYKKAMDGAAVEDLGFLIDQFARGYPLEELRNLPENPESQCGDNERTDVVCYAGSHPTEYGKADAVAKLLIDNMYLCTAWRVSSDNFMMTNEHCISDQADVSATEVMFDYQRALCESGAPNIPDTVTGNTFLVDNYELDFALFTVNDFASISGYGYLEMDPRTPVYGEEIYIPQHGAGNPKEFGIESDMDTGGVCRIDDAILNGRGTNTDTGYYCDTTGGSSGSPVLARSNHEVIGLHHFGTGGAACDSDTMNSAVRIDLIYPIVEPFIYGGCSGDSYEPDNSSGQANWIFDGSPQTHNICPVGDEDWVMFTLSTESAIALETSGPSGDTRMWLYDSGLTELDYNDDGGIGLFSYIDRECGLDALPAGTYYVKVDEYGDNNEIATYDLAFDVLESCAGVAEPDIAIAPESLSSMQVPDQLKLRTFDILNLGGGDLDWMISEHPGPSESALEVEASGDPLQAREEAGGDDAYLPSQPSTDEAPAESVAEFEMPESILWHNDPLFNSAGTGAGGANESMLQNISLGMSTIGFGHQASEGFRIADDFTISDPAGWEIDYIYFYAYQTGSSTTSSITALNYRIWDGPPNDPGSSVVFGDTTTNRLVHTAWSGVYRVQENTSGDTARPVMVNMVSAGVYLPQGTYWLDWQADGSVSYSGPWAPPIMINGQATTGNAMQWTGSWAPAQDSGTITQQGFPFFIEGSVASLLWDSGPLANSPGTGAGGADESMLQSLSLGMNTIGWGHQASDGLRIADDFTISDPSGWDIETITVFAYQTGSSTTSPITAVNLRIWDGPPEDPGSSVVFGDTTTNRLAATTWSNIYRVSESSSGDTSRPVMANTLNASIHLEPGTYWLDWQADGSVSYSGPWAPPITINGETTTGNALQYSSGSWSPILDSGTSTPQGFPVLIAGTIGGCPAGSNIPWVFTSPTGGTTSPGGYSTISLTFDSSGLAPGSYSGELCIESNDPDEGALWVPLSMEVTAAPDISVSPADFTYSLPIFATDVGSLAIGNSGVGNLNWLLSTAIIGADVPGDWTVYYDWGCDGSPGIATITFYDDFSFQTSGGEGHWVLSRDQIVFIFESYGTDYAGTVNGDTIEGTMASSSGNTGCWTAERGITASDRLQDGERGPSGAIKGETTPTIQFNQGFEKLLSAFGLPLMHHKLTDRQEGLLRSPDSGEVLEQNALPVVRPERIELLADLSGGVNILYDLSHGQRGLSWYSTLVADLMARGATILESDATFTGELFAADILWVDEWGAKNWTDRERDIVNRWVRDGHGLILHGDQVDSGEVLASMFAINYTGVPGTAGTTSNILLHPITSGVGQVYLSSPLNSLSASGSASCIVSDISGSPNVCVNSVGAGRVIVVADDEFTDSDISSAQNQLLANQAFDWLAAASDIWLSASPSAGSTPSSSTTFVDIGVDASIPAGEHHGAVFIFSNDPDEHPYGVHVTLTVDGLNIYLPLVSKN
jgi:hypothetical protein